jgi:dTDP-4-dehydrorhamnose reductase
MEKVLVLGNRGMLGHVLFDLLLESENYHVYGVNRGQGINGSDSYKLDVLDFEELELIIDEIVPDYVVNCIGSLVQASVNSPSKAILTNSVLPHVLNELSGKCNFRLIHISTDCVFNGDIGNYDEAAFKTETNMYGLSKNIGEIDSNKNLTIRTSIIGPELKIESTGLFEWVKSQKNSTINGYTNVMWSGLTTLELSKFILWVLKEPIYGLIHATNNKPISKYNLIKKINNIFEFNIDLKREDSKISDKSIINTKIDYHFNDYDDMLIETKEWLKNYSYE